jgi:hypothetical protein
MVALNTAFAVAGFLVFRIMRAKKGTDLFSNAKTK